MSCVWYTAPHWATEISKPYEKTSGGFFCETFSTGVKRPDCSLLSHFRGTKVQKCHHRESKTSDKSDRRRTLHLRLPYCTVGITLLTVSYFVLRLLFPFVHLVSTPIDQTKTQNEQPRCCPKNGLRLRLD